MNREVARRTTTTWVAPLSIGILVGVFAPTWFIIAFVVVALTVLAIIRRLSRR